MRRWTRSQSMKPINGIPYLLILVTVQLQLVAQAPQKRVFCDYHLGPRTRAKSGVTSIWRLYDDPSDTTTTFFPQIRWSGDGYQTADRKETVCTYCPVIGTYDATDTDLQEY